MKYNFLITYITVLRQNANFLKQSNEVFDKNLIDAKININDFLHSILVVIQSKYSNGVLFKEFIDGWNANITIIDKYQFWSTLNPNSTLHNCDYLDFKSDIKYKLIISILGANLLQFEKLLRAAINHLTENGTVLIGVRISGEIEYQNALKIIYKIGFNIEKENSFKIESLGEKLPLISLKKSNIKYNYNDLWRITRELFIEIKSPKRFYGIEGYIINELICNGKELIIDKREWGNGDFFQIRVVEKNGILYRIITNSFGDLMIETPIEADDLNNKIDNMLLYKSNMPDFWKSCL